MTRIGVMIPSRGRPQGLDAAIRSLLFTAHPDHRADLRFAVALDRDDPTLRESERIAEYLGARTMVFSPRLGYGRIWGYFNELADQLMGDGCEWLLLFNDDATMTGPVPPALSWDQALRDQPDYVLVADFANHHSPGLITFPCVRARAVAHLGGSYIPPILRTVHVDSVWQELGRRSGTAGPLIGDLHDSGGIFIRHHRPDLTGHAADETFLAGRGHLNHTHFYSEDFQRELDRAAGLLRIREGAPL